MFSFAGWNFIGSISGLLRDQGINILFNVFCGPIINAARGLAIQVQTAVFKFSSNFYVAVQPQITKSYASDNVDESHDLVLRSSRFCFSTIDSIDSPIDNRDGFHFTTLAQRGTGSYNSFCSDYTIMHTHRFSFYASYLPYAGNGKH